MTKTEEILNELDKELNEVPMSSFVKSYMKNIVVFDLSSDDSLDEAEKIIFAFKSKLKKFIEYYKKRREELEKELTYFIKVGSDLENWDNKNLTVTIDKQRILITFTCNNEKGKLTNVTSELMIAEYYSIYDWNGKIRTEYEGKSFQINDVFEIRFPNIHVNLMRGELSDEPKSMQVWNYISKEFYKKSESDGLMEKIRGIYTELRIVWQNMDDVSTALSIMNTKKDDYCFKRCIKEVRKMNLFNLDNLDKTIMVFSQGSEFIEFLAYTIKSVRNKYMTVDYHIGKFDCAFRSSVKEGEGGHYRHYLKIKTEDHDLILEKEKFIETVGRKLFRESKIEIYTQDDFDNLCLMYSEQRMNICIEGDLPDYLNEISEKYGRLVKYQKENYHLL